MFKHRVNVAVFVLLCHVPSFTLSLEGWTFSLFHIQALSAFLGVLLGTSVLWELYLAQQRFQLSTCNEYYSLDKYCVVLIRQCIKCKKKIFILFTFVSVVFPFACVVGNNKNNFYLYQLEIS